jgi:hypothetical protein
MNIQNSQKLFNDFPHIFKPNRPPQQGLMCFGFDCGDGWYDLIYKLCEDITTHLTENPDVNPVEATQVKEKFGGLRFYIWGGDSHISDLIYKAEHRSYDLCEICGKDQVNKEGHKGGWIVTLCDEHYRRYQNGERF